MSTTPTACLRLLTLDPARPPAPPGWAIALAPVAAAPIDNGLCVQTSSGPSGRLVTVTARSARSASPAEMEEIARVTYARLREDLCDAGELVPVRFWNHIPGIGEAMPGGLDRYRVFNKGRKEALAEWFGEGAFDLRLPTATGVGHEGEDLVVHCLACRADPPGRPVENPRQRPAYRYSPRYGPASPSFARATELTLGRRGRRALLVGGTAAVRGEDSVHEGDLDGQFEETIANLRALLIAAETGAEANESPAADPLERFTSVRVYHRDAEHEDDVRCRALSLFPRATVIELMRADICRPELLVEIEGLAELDPAPAPPPGASPTAAGAARAG